MNLREKQIKEDYIYKGRIINLRKDTVTLPNGKEALREVVEHNGGVCVAAITDNDEVIFVKQFRYPYLEEILEIPAGKRDSATEDPLLCGKRELKEETGAVAEDYLFLGELYPTPGYCAEKIWMFAAKNLKFKESSPDEDEFVEVYKIKLDDAVKMILAGEIKDAKTQAALLKLKLLKENGEF